jgi:5'-3' exonuclease
MGVPRLFPYLLSIFPYAVRHFQQGEFFIYVDNLYIDAPSLLHAAMQHVFNYGAKERKLDPYRGWSFAAKLTMGFKFFFDSISEISDIVRPTKVLYIGIDGPAPFAKMVESRSRRFISALRREKGGDPNVFDSASMTPGTVFMLELTKYVHTAIRKKIMEPNSSWRDLNVYFSSPTVAGEGEHKALNFIRALPKYVSENESHVIFGPDGDLIMLALAAHMPKMFLFREDQYSIGFYHLIDMGMVRDGLPKVLGQIPSIADGKRTLNEASDDFILAGFFVGNDFLPKIQMFMFLEDGLELMLATCTRIGNPADGGSGSVLTERGKISHAGFTRFIEELARREIVYIADQARIPPADPRFKNETLLRHITFGPEGTPKLNMGGYRREYYQKSHLDVQKDGAVKGMCMDYLKSIVWVFQYYVHGIPSWRHFYPWHYAPLMGDLAMVMAEMTEDEWEGMYTFTPDQPLLPFVQLLCVLPPASAGLLPAPLRPLLLSPDSPLVKKGFYPTSFEFDYEGKTREHMAVTKLPFVDVAAIEEAYRPIASTLKNKYVRNIPGRPEMFRYDPEYLASYESDYGKIAKLKVRKYVL